MQSEWLQDGDTSVAPKPNQTMGRVVAVAHDKRAIVEQRALEKIDSREECHDRRKVYGPSSGAFCLCGSRF